MRYKHYSLDDSFIFDRNYNYGTKFPRNDKPRGFWISVPGEYDWKQWCIEEEFRTEALSNEFDVQLRPNARILTLSTVAEINVLSTLFPGESYTTMGSPGEDNAVGWRDIESRCDGIIISPYQWACRLSVAWYYSWDCASGCIWNLDAIESVTPAANRLLGSATQNV